MNPISILRSAQSTPYIRSPTEATNEKENSNECLSARHTRPDQVQFNTGCSSSSSDLSQLVEIYNDSGDGGDFDEWLLQYKKQRLHNGLFGSETLSVGFEGYLSDSCGNLTPQSCSAQSVCDKDSSNNHSNNLHRSMDVLPTIKEGFYRLEKCVSVEFPPKVMVPPSKLCRSKEMQNILIEDDYE